MKTILLVLLRGCAVLLLAVMVLWTAGAAAELSFSFEVDGKYEDNVIGLTADNPSISGGSRGGLAGGGMSLKGGMPNIPGMGGTGTGGGTGTQGDYSTTLYADIGSDHDVADATSLLFLLSAEHRSYSTFNDFDFTIGTVSAGISHEFSETFSGKFALNASRKEFQGTERDSTAFGASAGLKERLSDPFWLKQTIDAEHSTATSSLFSYTGVGAGIRAGYDISDSQQVSVGYSYLVRDYKNSAPSFKLTSQVVSLDWILDLNDEWTVLAGYGREHADSNIANTATNNNIYTVGIQYAY